MKFKEGDLVLRVGLTEAGESEGITTTGYWTAGRPYAINRWGNVHDDDGESYAGPERGNRFNEFVPFDALYDEALKENEEIDRRASKHRFKAGDVAVYMRPQGTDSARLIVGKPYDVHYDAVRDRPFVCHAPGDKWYIDEDYADSFDLYVAPALVYDALPPAEPTSNAVFQPHHYARFTIEPITFINANQLPYNIGNVIKYACRYDAKNGVEDLEKAKRYLEIQIETIRRQERVAAGEDAKDVWKVTI
jgi:hypothetical protein